LSQLVEYLIPCSVQLQLYLSKMDVWTGCYGHATSLVWMQQSLGVTVLLNKIQHYVKVV